jgi:hypothetical protein
MLELPPENLYIIRDPKNFLSDMRDDVKLLHDNRRYLSLTTMIMCCLDALAAGSGDADKGKFQKYVTKNFPDLCAALKSAASEAHGRESNVTITASPKRFCVGVRPTTPGAM